MTINFKDYQKAAMTFAVYPREFAVTYSALGLAGEAGELANKVKKLLRGDENGLEIRDQIMGEMGDVLWYLAALAQDLDVSLADIANQNLEKLTDRKARGKIKGAGDNR